MAVFCFIQNLHGSNPAAQSTAGIKAPDTVDGSKNGLSKKIDWFVFVLGIAAASNIV